MFRSILTTIAAVTLIALGCSDDHGIAPLPGRLGVDVIFLQEQIPENTQGVYLFVAPVFPPHAINELYLSPNSLPLDRDTVHTEIVLPYGHYEAVGLWWFNTETVSNLADVFTLKIDSDFLPWEFDLDSEHPSIRTELYANLKRVERDATLKGTITFNGPFPANTLATAIGAYIKKPESKVDYLIYLESMDFSIDENPYDFELPVTSRFEVKYLAVFWLSDRSGLDDFKTLGFYQDPEAPGQPGSIRLQPNQTVIGLDIAADWSKTGAEP